MNLRAGDSVSALAKVISAQNAGVNGDSDELSVDEITLEEIAGENGVGENGGGITDG